MLIAAVIAIYLLVALLLGLGLWKLFSWLESL
ncbi:hypothetical protein CLAC_04255 [Corynebacterium lactis RW2-5]|uniref:Uncharacterized protein n=1 Tax=Corynebacterium lactis RW2-5 TaxID=1408189 RepID=A0A0K2H3G6_9CORY|nr:hypothetical protein CLAC_04255 [Corynebacterium lactis RW2-5]